MGSGVSRVMTGSFTSDGAARNVRTVGFRPKKVEVMNVTSRDRGEWTNTMANASMLKQVAAGTGTFITSNGITPLSDGFTLGADADVNAADEVVHWVAYE